MNKKNIKPQKLPSFDCPNPSCNAKNVIFAANRQAKNNSELILYNKDIPDYFCIDFIAMCPKCKSYIALCNHSMINVEIVNIHY